MLLAVRTSDNNVVKQLLLDGLVALGCIMLYMRDVKDMGQQMGYHSLQIPIWTGIVDKSNNLDNHSTLMQYHFST